MTEQYECPNCGTMNSLWPVFSGRRRYYQCESCGKQYGSKQLDKIWNVEPSKSSISVTPISEKTRTNEILKGDGMKMQVTCDRCGWSRSSTAQSASKVRFTCKKCGSKSFRWSWMY